MNRFAKLPVWPILICMLVLIPLFQNFDGANDDATEIGDGIPEEAAANATVDIDVKSSVMITDHQILDAIESETDFGQLLTESYNYNNNVVAPKFRRQKENFKGGPASAGEYISRIFQLAYREQVDHAKLPAGERLGGVPQKDRYMDRVFKNWMTPEEMRKAKGPGAFRKGPFRLLAVVNLTEAAATIDNRGTNEAAAFPRALGEMHLVYGLIDKEYEKSGRVYPQTFVLTYRIPPLKRVRGQFRFDDKVSLDKLMFNQDQWREQMKMWASLWIGLSKPHFGSREYLNHLKKVLGLITKADNFIDIRSNTKINDDEFELREWYILLADLQMIPRKPRNEPYRCLSGSREMTKLVQQYWVDEKSDLNVFTYSRPANPGPGDSGNGYFVPRDNEFPLFSEQDDFSTCPKTPNNMPFEMYSDGDGFMGGKRVVIAAPFARVKGAGAVWDLRDDANEAQRHAFAIRTCSGCHSQEGAARGFHIAPRAKNKDSELSPFLTGKGRNKFSHGGVDYSYETLLDRKKWLRDSFNGTAVMYDSLIRKDKR